MTPEQKQQYRKDWEERSEKRRILIEQMCSHHNSHGCTREAPCPEYEKLIEDFRDVDPEYCEHGRHRYSAHCIGCDEDFKEVFPEFFGACQKCNELVDLDELDGNKHCFNCQGEA